MTRRYYHMETKKSTLYDLTGAWLDLYDMADDPDMDADVWFDTIEGLEGEIEDKADGYARVITQLNADMAAIKAEEDRLYNRRKTIENRISNMKSRLQSMMELTGKTKFKTPLFSFSVQKNPPRCVIDNKEEVPDEFLISQEPKIDTAGILKSMKDGVTYEWAHMERSSSLRIR
jgi:sugar-specific transcriptional regulator TrmB